MRKLNEGDVVKHISNDKLRMVVFYESGLDIECRGITDEGVIFEHIFSPFELELVEDKSC